MKKRMGLKLCAIFLALSFIGCSSEILEERSVETSSENREYGSLVINESSRSLDVNSIKIAKVTVSSSDMSDVVVSSSVQNGKGTFVVEKIPVGKNRIVSVDAYDENEKSISGFVIRQIVDVNAGSNSVTVNWDTTGLANVYSELLNKGKKIADFTDNQNSSIKNAIPTSTKGYLVDSVAIANDFVAGSLKSSESYKMNYASLIYNAVSANGYKITVLDPTSNDKTISSDGSGSVMNVAPGTWLVRVFDGAKYVLNKTVSFTSSSVFDLGTIGDPLEGKVIVFVKGTDMNIWAWEKTGTGNGVELSKVLGGAWGTSAEGKTKMTAATNAYMHDPNGWSMFDYTSVSSGGEICFKLNWSDPERFSGRKTTFWFDGVNFYDTDPTANQVSSDATLASISVNGTNIEGFDAFTESYSYMISATTESAFVKGVATNENATVTVSPSSAVIDNGSSRLFEITVTAEDGVTQKTYSVNVKRAIKNDTSLASITINGKSAVSNDNGSVWTYEASGSEDSLVITSIVATAVDSSANITVSKKTGTVTDGSSFVTTITVVNGTNTKSYTLNVTYTKKEVISGEYYWTNKNGAVGSNKTISSWSDWTEAEKIVQCAAYDDPRTWKGHQEVPYDVYALYAAYDNTNLYLMVELTNIADNRATFMNHDYAGSDNAWWNNRDCPIGMIFNTGKGKTSTKPTIGASGKPIWDAIDFSDAEGFDALFYHSSKYGTFEGKHVGVGTPGYFKTTNDGKFSYDANYCLSFNAGSTKGTSGISVQYQRKCAVSKTIWFESTPTDNRTTSAQDGKALMDSTTYKSCSTNDLDMSYWYTIPLSTLGIDKTYLESTGISVRQLTPNGGSLMDCAPWDVSMVDVASDPCSDDASTSHEKEDVDNITSPQARIGKM